MVKKIQPRKALHNECPEPEKQPIKIGLILECSQNGPDRQVCKYLIEQLQPETKVVSRTMDSKKNLIPNCGKVAESLLNVDKCQRVVIVWDARPAWSVENPIAEEFCLHEERKAIFESLEQASIPFSDVYLVCIFQELETWLIADNRALTTAIKKLKSHHAPRVRRVKNISDPESEKKPKERLMKIFEPYTPGYRDYLHAIQIVKELRDFDKIGRCESFKRFVLKATDIVL